MYRRVYAAIALLSVVCFVSTAAAQTPVSGSITTTTWTLSGSPYQVVGPITVPSGETLTIEPGVDVLFDVETPLLVEGALIAEGTSADSISFGLGASAAWKGIRFVYADSSRLAYVRITDATATAASWPDGYGGGMYLRGESVVSLSNSLIADCHAYVAGGGVAVDSYSSLTARNTVISRCGVTSDGGGGVYVGSGSICDVRNSVITSCTSLGSGGNALMLNGGEFRAENTILWGNTNYTATWLYLIAGTVDITYSSLDEAYGGVGNIAGDPAFTDALSDDYTLQAGSPCIDVGNPYIQDSDFTRSDMGAFGGEETEPAIPRAELSTDTLTSYVYTPAVVYVRNTGWDVLQITGVNLPTNFSHSLSLPADVLPGDSLAVTISYTGTTDIYGQTVSFVNSDAYATPLALGVAGVTGAAVSGSVSGTWTNAVGRYHVTGPISVDAGATLAIEPGVVVEFDQTVEFTVSGSLDAVGAESDTIEFRSGLAADWGGLRIGGADSSTLSHVKVTGAYNANYGGALWLGSEAHVAVISSRFAGNASGSWGGNVATVSGSTMLWATDTEFSGGTAMTGGNVAVRYGGAEFDGCSFTGGVATNTTCGGLVTYEADVTLSNCLLTGNAATTGAAISLITGSNAKISNCTVADNSGGDGVGLYVDASATAYVKSTIFWNTGAATEISDGSGVAKITYSDINGGFGAAADSNIALDPLFTNTTIADYTLQAGSPCIDAGFPYDLDADETRADMGYTGGTGGNAAVPRIEVSPGVLATFTRNAQNLTIYNTGWGDLTVTDLGLSPVLFYSAVSFPETIAAGDSLVVPISFLGTSAETNVPYTISHNDVYHPDVTVFYNGDLGSGHVGEVTGTWLAVDNPHRIPAGIWVPAGGTLTIGAGVEVLFDADVPLKVYGALDVEGAFEDTVRFGPGRIAQWGGIRAVDSDTVELEYARIRSCYTDGNEDAWPSYGGAVLGAGTGTVVVLRHCVLDNNYATYGGGVAAMANSRLEMYNTLAFGNSGSYGGAVYSDVPDAHLESCTFADNIASYGGGGLYSYMDGAIVSCIMWGNTSNSLQGCYDFEVSYSDIEGGWSGTDNINTDPLFTNVASNDYTLQVGSPCIDTGNPYAQDTDETRADMGFTGGGGPDPLIPRVELKETELFVGSAAPAELMVYNTGWADLELWSVALPAQFNTSTTFTAVVPAGDSLGIDLNYTGTGITESGSSYLEHNDYNQSDFPFTVNGCPGTPIVSDSLWGTLTAAGSPYCVMNGEPYVAVPEGKTLEIEDNVELLMVDGQMLVAAGRIHARGTAENGIFLSGFSTERDPTPWMGVMLGPTADTSSFAYTIFMGGIGVPETGDPVGGALTTMGPTSLYLNNCVFAQNAQVAGGAVCLGLGTTAVFDSCMFAMNMSVFGGAMCAYGSGTSVTLRRTMFLANIASSDGQGGVYRPGRVSGEIVDGGPMLGAYGGAVFLMDSALVSLENCTVAGNQAELAGGGAYVGPYSTLNAVNTVVYGNMADQISLADGTASANVTYSDIMGGWAGEGNIDADPLFSDPGSFNLTLAPGSPCASAGDPAWPRDPDGSRTDMGMYAYEGEQYILPADTSAEGNLLIVEVTATAEDAMSMEFAMLIDTTIIRPDANFIRYNAFDDQVGGQTVSYFGHDTVAIAMASQTSAWFNGSEPEKVLELAFRFQAGAPYDTTMTIEWVPAPRTQVNETAVPLSDARFFLPIIYGDVTGNRNLTAYDAAVILAAVVAPKSGLDLTVADVTGLLGVTAEDAAMVLRKVVSPSYLFPVEGGVIERPARDVPRTLAWVIESDGWALTVSDPSDISSCQLTMTLPTTETVTVSGPELHAIDQNDSEVRLALVRGSSTGDVLFRLHGVTSVSGLPQVSDIMINEGAIPVSGFTRPIEFMLSANVPNPFNPTTSISYGVTHQQQVTLAVYNLLGQRVATLVDGVNQPGIHTVVWNGRDAVGRAAASGVYIYRLTAEEGVLTRRMMLVR